MLRMIALLSLPGVPAGLWVMLGAWRDRRYLGAFKSIFIGSMGSLLVAIPCLWCWMAHEQMDFDRRTDINPKVSALQIEGAWTRGNESLIIRADGSFLLNAKEQGTWRIFGSDLDIGNTTWRIYTFDGEPRLLPPYATKDLDPDEWCFSCAYEKR